ncbi:hypothetical protein TNCV_4290611 [Trichonephila clavipes]|nr:hypothetical protein TNCV_4290611 [Trichonephila clavipes]
MVAAVAERYRYWTVACFVTVAHQPLRTKAYDTPPVGLKCHSGPKDSSRGLVKRRDKAPSQAYCSHLSLRDLRRWGQSSGHSYVMNYI